MDSVTMKQTKAKIYNLKNGIEGLLPLLDSGVLEEDKIGEAIATLAAKAVDELNGIK